MWSTREVGHARYLDASSKRSTTLVPEIGTRWPAHLRGLFEHEATNLIGCRFQNFLFELDIELKLKQGFGWSHDLYGDHISLTVRTSGGSHQFPGRTYPS